MKKSLTLVAYPKVPGAGPRDGMQLSGGRHQGQNAGDVSLGRMPILDLRGVRRYRDKPAILKVGSAALRERPNPPCIVLKERLPAVIWQSGIGHLACAELSLLFGAAAHSPCALLSVNRDLAVIPSVHTIRSAEPDAAVLGSQDGPDDGGG